MTSTAYKVSIIGSQNGIGVDCNNIPPTGEDVGSNEVQAGVDQEINGDTRVDREASPSDSDSLSSYGGSSSSQSSSNAGHRGGSSSSSNGGHGGGVSSGSEGQTDSGSEDQDDVRSKITQLRSVATLLKRKADELEASL